MSHAKVPVEDLQECFPLLSPQRPVLVSSRFHSGRVNVAPFTWCSPISHKPPMVALALLTLPRRQRSLINILRDEQFVVNVPGPELAERLVKASFWYPKGVSKLEFLGFETAPAQELDVPVLAECRAHIECRLQQAIPTGDHTLLIAAVVAASYDPELYTSGLLLDLQKAAPLLHLRHFSTTEGQVHIFYGGRDSWTYHVPFPPGALDALGRPAGDEEQ